MRWQRPRGAGASGPGVCSSFPPAPAPAPALAPSRPGAVLLAAVASSPLRPGPAARPPLQPRGSPGHGVLALLSVPPPLAAP